MTTSNDELKSCPKCGAQLATRRCDALGCDEGTQEDDDGLGWVDVEKCDECNGNGFVEWCRSCGWDEAEGQFLSPQYEAEWKAKENL